MTNNKNSFMIDCFSRLLKHSNIVDQAHINSLIIVTIFSLNLLYRRFLILIGFNKFFIEWTMFSDINQRL